MFGNEAAGEQALERSLRLVNERLDYIEKYLTHLGHVAGYRYAPFGSALSPEVMALAQAGKMKDAIARYRQDTNASFAQAQETIAKALAEG